MLACVRWVSNFCVSTRTATGLSGRTAGHLTSSSFKVDMPDSWHGSRATFLRLLLLLLFLESTIRARCRRSDYSSWCHSWRQRQTSGPVISKLLDTLTLSFSCFLTLGLVAALHSSFFLWQTNHRQRQTRKTSCWNANEQPEIKIPPRAGHWSIIPAGDELGCFRVLFHLLTHTSSHQRATKSWKWKFNTRWPIHWSWATKPGRWYLSELARIFSVLNAMICWILLAVCHRVETGIHFIILWNFGSSIGYVDSINTFRFQRTTEREIGLSFPKCLNKSSRPLYVEKANR